MDIRKSNELRQAVNTLSVGYTQRIRSKWFALLALVGQLSPQNRSINSAREVIDGVTHRIIKDLRKQTPSNENLLIQLAQVQDSDTGKRLRESELKAEISTLLLAGYETTARALTWCLYLLSRHPESANNAADEADKVLAGRQPTSADIDKLSYHNWIIQESLRLYPSIYAFSRRSEQDEIIGNYLIPKGARILVSPYVAHRLPEFWSNPDEFRPERFSSEESQKRPTHAYIPFGAGPRQCIGRRFAMLEMQLIVPMILQRFKLSSASQVPVVPEPLGTLTPKDSIHLTITKR